MASPKRKKRFPRTLHLLPKEFCIGDRVRDRYSFYWGAKEKGIVMAGSNLTARHVSVLVDGGQGIQEFSVERLVRLKPKT